LNGEEFVVLNYQPGDSHLLLNYCILTNSQKTKFLQTSEFLLVFGIELETLNVLLVAAIEYM
jgi:hypothetical protein